MVKDIAPGDRLPWFRVRAHWVLLGVILLVAVGLRFHQLGEQSLWLDELYSLASSTARYPNTLPLRENEIVQPLPRFTSLDSARPWTSIWTGMRAGTHPPLYIVLLRFWREAFGESDAAARALSVVTSLVVLLLIYDAGRILSGIPAGLWAAALAAVAWPQLQYAQEARPYAVLMALGMGALCAMLRTARSGPTPARLVTLALCMLAMALTHYFAFGALLALGLFALAHFRGRNRVKVLAAITLAGAAFLVAWGPSLWAQRHTTQFAFLVETAPNPVEIAFWRFDELPQRYLIDRSQEIIPLLGTAAWVALGVLAWRRREFALPVLWMMLTAGFIAALDIARSTSHLEWLRYTLLASPPLYLVIAGLLAGRREPGVAHLLPAAALLICMLSLPRFYDGKKEDWRGLGAHIRNTIPPDQPMVFAASQSWYAADLCIGLSHYQHSDQRPVLVLTRPADGELLAQLRQYPSLWLISDQIDPTTLLPEHVVESETRISMLAGRSPFEPGTPAWLIRRLRLVSDQRTTAPHN
jgi:hypothetical protein